MGHSDELTRRRYERISGRGTTTELLVPGDAPRRLVINDLSLGGVALRTDWSGPAGMGVALRLPGAEGPVAARVVRSDGGILGLSFQQKEGVLRLVEQAIAFVEAIALEEAA